MSVDRGGVAGGDSGEKLLPPPRASCWFMVRNNLSTVGCIHARRSFCGTIPVVAYDVVLNLPLVDIPPYGPISLGVLQSRKLIFQCLRRNAVFLSVFLFSF